MPKLVRVLTYTGPQKWLESCIDNAFVVLEQELGPDKKITSQWRDVKAQRRALLTSDNQRRERLQQIRLRHNIDAHRANKYLESKNV